VAKVFISYARKDRQRIGKILTGLSHAGIDYWLDEGIHTGADWRRELESQLEQARVILVVWSNVSVKSHNVVDEAQVGVNRRILVPVQIDGGEMVVPIGFRGLQTTDLSNWSGEAAHSAWQSVIAAIQRVLDGRQMPAPRGVEGRSRITSTDSLRDLVDAISRKSSGAPPPWSRETWKRRKLHNPIFQNLTRPLRKAIHHVLWHKGDLYYARGRSVSRFRSLSSVSVKGGKRSWIAPGRTRMKPVSIAGGGTAFEADLPFLPFSASSGPIKEFEGGEDYAFVKMPQTGLYLRAYSEGSLKQHRENQKKSRSIEASYLNILGQLHSPEGDPVGDTFDIGKIYLNNGEPQVTIRPSPTGRFAIIYWGDRSFAYWRSAGLFKVVSSGSSQQMSLVSSMNGDLRHHCWHPSRDILLTDKADTGYKGTSVIFEFINAETGGLYSSADIGVKGGVGGLDWSTSGRYIVARSADSRIRIADLSNDNITALGGEEKLFFEWSLHGISPDEKRVFVLDRFDKLTIYSLPDGEELAGFGLFPGDATWTTRISGAQGNLLWSEDSRSIVVRSGRDIEIYSVQ